MLETLGLASEAERFEGEHGARRRLGARSRSSYVPGGPCHETITRHVPTLGLAT